ncbi:MAG TPA: RNA methyltransferase [Terriglobia bacterium]|nr:RNA methyltransferase [Terriglobia bacterium]
MVERNSARNVHREINSTANPLLKLFRHALAEGVTREGWLAIEGPHSLEEALTAGPNVTPQSVLVSETAANKFQSLLTRLPGGTEVAVVPDGLFSRVAATPSPQGIAALVELKTGDLDALLSHHDALFLVACGVQDPGNLGTMMRSAQALGATALLTLKETVSPFNPKATRSSAGAIFHLPIFPGLEAAALFKQLQGAGVRIVALDRESPHALHRADLKGSIAFLIGREGSGLPEGFIRDADLLLSIPIRPGMDSVNAATAAGIFLYEAARQRGFKKM